MNAKKCDRCGCFYDVSEVQKAYFGDPRYVLFRITNHEEGYKIDLCPCCVLELVNFMQNSDGSHYKEEKCKKEK